MGKKILVAGVGNKLMGDDGFGPAVIESLSSLQLPTNVEARDFGTSGLALAIELGRYDTVIFLDAVKRGSKPGTLHILELHSEEITAGEVSEITTFTPHEIRLESLLSLAKAIDTLPKRITIIGCEPRNLGLQLGLSQEVRRAVARAVRLVLKKIGEMASEVSGSTSGGSADRFPS